MAADGLFNERLPFLQWKLAAITLTGSNTIHRTENASARRMFAGHASRTRLCISRLSYLRRMANARGEPVGSKYANAPCHWRLRLYHHPHFDLSSAPLSS